MLTALALTFALSRPITFDIRLEPLSSLVVSKFSAWNGLATSAKASDVAVKWLDPQLSRYGEEPTPEEQSFWSAVAFQKVPLQPLNKNDVLAKKANDDWPEFKRKWQDKPRRLLGSYAGDLREALSNFQVQRDLEQLPKLVGGDGVEYRVNLVDGTDRKTSMFAVGENVFVTVGAKSNAREDVGQILELLCWQRLRGAPASDRKAIDVGLTKSDLPRGQNSPLLFDQVMAITIGKGIIQGHVSPKASANNLASLGKGISLIADELGDDIGARLASGKSIYSKEVLDLYISALKKQPLD